MNFEKFPFFIRLFAINERATCYTHKHPREPYALMSVLRDLAPLGAL